MSQISLSENIMYRLADGRIWDVQKADWASASEVSKITTVSDYKDQGNAIHSEPSAPREIIDLVSADDQSNIEYLVKTLDFYDYPLGELVWFSVKGIKETLARIDEIYLTPRVLAGMAIGDQYALSQWYKHEEQATPLRERLAELQGQK